jgi:putative oxidoreductase
MGSPRQLLFDTTAPSAVLLIRLAAGLVFFSEGIQKFLFPAELGVGPFATVGLPAPDALAPFLGTCEIVCGTLVGGRAWSIDSRLSAAPKATSGPRTRVIDLED